MTINLEHNTLLRGYAIEREKNMEWNTISEYCALLILLIIWTYEKKGSTIPSLKNIIFRCCLIVTFLSILSNIGSTIMISQYQLYPQFLTYIITAIYFITTPIMGLFYFYYVISIIYHNRNDIIKKIMISSGIPALLFLCFILTNHKTGYIFQLTEQGYFRGNYILSTYAIFYLYCILSMVFAYINKKKENNKTLGVLMLFPFLSTIIIIFQQTHPEIILSGFTATSALLIVYLYLQNRQIYIDYLTRLPNRWELLNMLNYLFNQKNPQFTLIVVSIKDFKMINNHYGQKVGDAFLQKISKELYKLCPSDSVYRFNGDEFAILLTKKIDETTFIKTLQQKLNKMWNVDTYNYYLSSAIGVVSYSNNYQNVDAVIQSIEYAVISAKKMPKSYICYYDEQMFLKMERKKQIIDILKTKLQDENFEMYYQPIFSMNTHDFAYIESLIRINDTPIGPIYPSEFIPIAEESGIIIEMTYVILSKVCQFIKQAMNENIPFECVHVNFSPLQFSQIDLSQHVLEIINKHQIPSHKIKIEFTESAVAESTDAVIRFAKQMNLHGIKMGLDDFGTGYSNVSTVMSIPFHAIKLDRSLVLKSIEDCKAAAMLKSMITAFHAIDMQVVAEGVETQEQFDIIKEYGVDQIQGYYFSKPLPHDTAILFLKQHNIPQN